MPEREMVRGELDASETTEMLPVTLPAAFGAKNHVERKALSWYYGNGQAQSIYAKGRASEIGLGDAHAGVAGIIQRFRLSRAVSHLHASKADA